MKFRPGTRVVYDVGLPACRNAVHTVIGPAAEPGKVQVQSMVLDRPILTVDESLLEVFVADRRHRAADPPTAVAAANRVDVTKGQWRVLDQLAKAGQRGLNDFEYSGIKQTSAGKRRIELERAGLCELAGFKRPSDTGDPAAVHRITTEGLRVWLAERRRWAS